ncbi:MAG: AMP-binding protein, partial [Actinomycetota bacterium]|nr:AMP-binding protein [Actinomycetota bacterium]
MIAGGVTTLTGALLAGGDGDAVALVDGADALTYHQLRARVADRRAELDLGQRDIVVLATTNTLEFVVTYLALLDGGHVPLLVGSHVERLTAAWRPAAVVTTSAVGIEIERCAGAARPLHPDLRLLLSTSGSTGAPKLVRLSDRNLVSNASAITEYLGLGAGDCGITSLPLHYCYGLSVLHSHLAAGARIVLTEASVVDPCFAAAMTAHGVTNVAGVPHTFDLLERAGPDRLRVPSLRFVTVAGGRLAASRVEEWAHRCAAWDAEFFVMYGQTEATARMAYLPPALALRRPGAIGVPIPGGSLELRPVDGAPDGVGELVYRGDNVMMGYATGDADLAAGAVVEELVTGDLGRFHDDNGVFEVVGRRSRFVKPFGLRIDLDVVEAELATTFGELAVTGDDERVIVCAPGANVAMVAAAVAALTGLPEG